MRVDTSRTLLPDALDLSLPVRQYVLVGAQQADWNRLAKRVVERRTLLGLTQEDVRARGGPSTATMRLIEGALQSTYRPSILRRLEAALGWTAGSATAILDGGQPSAEPNDRNVATSVTDESGTSPEEIVRMVLSILRSHVSAETKVKLSEQLIIEEFQPADANVVDEHVRGVGG